MSCQILNFKKIVSEPAPNRALDSIVWWTKGSPGRKDFVLWYLRQFGVKRLRRDKRWHVASVIFPSRLSIFLYFV